jgi:hypothetical protein
MFKRGTLLVWIGILTFSGMFLMGQEAWSPVGPQIASVAPDPAAPGEPITVHGSSFGSTQGTSELQYDGEALAVSSWSDTQIAATLQESKPSGTFNVRVIVGGSPSNVVPHRISNSIWGRNMEWGVSKWGD